MDANVNRFFTHEPLDTTNRQIRLFYLGRSLTADLCFQGTIKHTTLGQDHVCLSYMWGSDSEKDSKVILINGQRFKIRANLHDFLSAMFEFEYFITEWLWIDALCINQANLMERNHQVAMMGLIFSQAKRTVVYAGSGNWYVDLALRDAESWVRSLNIVETAPKKCTRAFPLSVPHGLWSKHRAGFRSLCKLPYWDRAWIKQEILLAKDLVFMYGNTLCCWQTIILIMSAAPTKEKAESDAVAVTLAEIQFKLSLHERLSRFKHLKCTDPRDRIFSLLGISKDGSVFPVDYSLSLTTLFVQALKFSHLDKLLMHDQRNQTGSVSNMILHLGSSDMATLRDVCDALSLCLFEDEFLNVNLNTVARDAEYLDLKAWRSNMSLKGRVHQLSGKTLEDRFLTKFYSGKSPDSLNKELDKEVFKTELTYVLIQVDDYNNFLGSSTKFQPVRNICMVCRWHRDEQKWKLVTMMAFGRPTSEEKFDCFRAEPQAICHVKSSVICCFPGDEIQDITDKSTSEDNLEPIQSHMTLQIDGAFLIELAQITDKLSIRKPVYDEDPGAGMAYHEGDGIPFK